jgi:predicted RNase H-like HicB family nuclease
MKQIDAVIERAKDGSYSVYCKDEIFSGVGNDIDSAKADMLSQMSFYKETALKEGFRYPPFLDEEYTINYKVDAVSLMKYYVYSGVFTLAGLEKITGVNQKQLWSYLNGTKPRKAQQDRIADGLRSICKDLSMFFA